MGRSLMRTLALGIALALALALAACGGSSSNNKSGNTGATQAPSNAKRGGTLKVLAVGDLEHFDPGQAYYQFDYMVTYATQRPLFSWKPNDKDQPSPDLAADAGTISDGGKTLTVHIKKGIKYSPPVNREVTSADVKYAIERAFTSSVPNGYVGTYLGDLVGAPAKQGPYKAISGITTPDKYTVVFKFAKSRALAAKLAMSLPVSAPVPKEYAQKFDQKNPSTYPMHQVFTGPYMVPNDSSGKVTGYKPGKSITLVRNPNWDKSTDYRPAYLDRVEIQEGVDPNVGGRQIMNGSHVINGDFAPTPPQIKQFLSQAKNDITFTPGGGNRYIAMNTTIKPFDNINVRKAVVAAANRNALVLTRGGKIVGDVATHYIPPGMPGFDEAGGMAGPNVDFLKNPNGDMALAKKYMQKAGYPSGKYTGKEKILMVGANNGVAVKTAQVTQDLFQKLGFNVQLRLTTPETAYSKYCNRPASKTAVCPGVGWLKDFNDAESILNPTFNGKAINAVNNNNWPQLNDPQINKELDAAGLLTDPTERAKAFGKIDDEITKLAVAIPWIWDKQGNIESKDVNGVINLENVNWDLSFTSLK